MRPTKIILPSITLMGLLAACGGSGNSTETSRESSPAASPRCTPTIGRVIGRMYTASNPANEIDGRNAAFEEQTVSAAKALSSNSPVITCAARVGTAMANGALRAFSVADGDRAYERAVAWGATPEVAAGVRESMTSGTVDTFAMGRELQWLATVLPIVAEKNDWTPYYQTGTPWRQQLRQGMAAMRALGQLSGDADPLTRQIMGVMGPIAEYQVASYLLFMDGWAE
jgi:hypothetical protein